MSAEQMRIFMKLTEASYTGPLDHPEVSYSAEEKKGEITKVVATLNGYQSGKYTKMGRNLLRISRINEKIEKLKEQIKQETRESIAELFHAEDAARTRVIDTVGFIFTMTKDPEPSNTVKYAKVLEELEQHLTPELVTVMEAIKAKYTTTVHKEPALIKVKDKKEVAEEGIDLSEGVWDQLKAFVGKFAQKIMSWASSYDRRLDKLKRIANVNESTNEAVSLGNNYEYIAKVLSRKEVGDFIDRDQKFLKLSNMSVVSKVGDEYMITRYLPGHDSPQVRYVKPNIIDDFGITPEIQAKLDSI